MENFSREAASDAPNNDPVDGVWVDSSEPTKPNKQFDGIQGGLSDLLEPFSAALSKDDTVADALAFLVRAKQVSEISYIYVLDTETLIGVINMRDLILSRPAERLENIMLADPFAFTLDMPMQECISEALARHYPVFPVVDEYQQLIGIVRGWKIYEHMAEQLAGQAGKQVGLDDSEQIDTPIWASFKMRHPWLQVNLLTAFAAAFVVGLFEDTIMQMVALAAFLPVLAGQSGNTGCQALAITLRGLTLGKLSTYPVAKLMTKEISLGALNGFFVGVVAAVAMFFYASLSGDGHPFMLALVILIAMVGACIGSGIFGVAVPLTLKKFGADPAMASSIFLTTFTDIIGMGLMLFLASTLIL